ncbi:MAG: hypothetical protein MK171_01580 [Pirellulales bacterium]|nr:hypothetical protein [Pirellulales bacterium]
MFVRTGIASMARMGLAVCLIVGFWHSASEAQGVDGRWKRVISYQNKKDLFANYQVGPNTSGAAARMYVSPQPVPPHVGHTYTTYQPLMPHEYLYKHMRSHYAYAPGCGWTRSKVRYRTSGLRLQDLMHNLSGRY